MSPTIDGDTNKKRGVAPPPPGTALDHLADKKSKTTAVLERQIEDMLKTLNQLFIIYEQTIQLKDREISELKKPIASDVPPKPEKDPLANADEKKDKNNK